MPLVRIETVEIEGQAQPFEMLKNCLKKVSFSRMYQTPNKHYWEKHLEGLREFNVLANQAVEFELNNRTKEVLVAQPPDLIPSPTLQKYALSQPEEDDTVTLRKISLTASSTSLSSPKREVTYNVSPDKISLRQSPQTMSPKSSSDNTIDKSIVGKTLDTFDSTNIIPPLNSTKIVEKDDNIVNTTTTTTTTLQSEEKTGLTKILERDKKICLEDFSSNNTTKPTVTPAAPKTTRPSLKRTKKGGSIKPPNILVYSESALTRDNVISTLHQVLSPDVYTVYPLANQDVVRNKIWIENTTLLVVCGNVPSSVGKILLDYFLNGGNMLCICSDVLHIIIPTFRMAEVSKLSSSKIK